MKKRRSKLKIAFLLILALILISATAFAVCYVLTGGRLFRPGEVTYDQSLTTEEQVFLDSILKKEDLRLKYDVTVSATSESSPVTDEKSILFDILVPTTDFYYAGSNIESTLLNSEDTDITITSIRDITPNEKMLALDGNYFFDTFDSGAIFRILHFDSEDITEAVNLVTPEIKTFPTADNTLSFAQTGVTALSRGMNKKLASVDSAAFFAENIKDFLSSKDLVHTSNEASFSKSATSDNICAHPNMIDTLTAIGLNIVELTGNHNQDCGNEDAIATIDTYESLGIKTVGGGRNADEAARPLKIEQKNTKITMLGYNLSTGGYTLGNTPGANYYTPKKAESDIAAAKADGDFVIVDVQYFECSEYDVTTESTACDAPISGQKELFRHLIDLGADIVIGTSAHQPQTYELYENGIIYYGLGNLFFDQSWWPGTTRSLIITHYFVDGEHKQSRLTATEYDHDYQTATMTEEKSTWFIDKINQAR